MEYKVQYKAYSHKRVQQKSSALELLNVSYQNLCSKTGLENERMVNFLR